MTSFNIYYIKLKRLIFSKHVVIVIILEFDQRAKKKPIRITNALNIWRHSNEFTINFI